MNSIEQLQLANSDLRKMFTSSLLNNSYIALMGNSIYGLDCTGGSHAFMFKREVKEDIIFDPCCFNMAAYMVFIDDGNTKWEAELRSGNINMVIDKWNNYEASRGEELACIINAKSSDSNFATMLDTFKADFGCMFYQLLGKYKTYMIPVMSGLPPVGKADDLDIFIYTDNFNPNYVWCRQVIHKKKLSGDFELIMSIMDL